MITNKVEIVAHSLSPQGEELISVLGTFPRIILAEVNTHRMLSKNTSSSRAIPFMKMVESVRDSPFIPFAWQKYHSGMQGTEYLDKTVKYDLISFMEILNDTLSNTTDEKERIKLKKRIEEKTKIIKEILSPYTLFEKTLPEWWLFARDRAVETASILYVFDVTKQLCNRLLEPFMWTTMLITGPRSGWDNFFKLRCPQYSNNSLLQKVYKTNGIDSYYKSKKELIKDLDLGGFNSTPVRNLSELDWLNSNKGQAEIHIMDLSEKIYDAVNESTPKELKPGEWHIPFGDKIHKVDTSVFNNPELVNPSFDLIRVKISTAMAARTSYTVVGDEKEIDYNKMIELHDRLLSQNPPHSSPLEHCARAMSDDEYNSYIKGNIHDFANRTLQKEIKEMTGKTFITGEATNEKLGWCNNFKGFIPYRYMIDKNLVSL